MDESVIQIRDVTRSYRLGDTVLHAVDGISLTINRGEFVSIMGSSGSGKSTLMNILGCLDRPTSGHYIFDGLDTAGLTEPQLARIRSERIGFVFQSFNLLPRTSALENVALPLFYRTDGPASAGERIERARTSLARLGLAERERNSPGQLSGGQQQRVAIARALINKPHVLLADEPTGNVDTRTAREIMNVLRELNRREGVTVVIVTHDPDVGAFTDRTITMRDGRIIADERRTPPIALADPALAELGTTPMRKPSRIAGIAALGFFVMVAGAAVQALARNKMRSALTMLGVFIGVAALIAMVAVGQGANAAVRKQIESLGTNLMVIMPGTTTASGVRAGYGSASTLTVSDAQAIRHEDDAVGLVSYTIRQIGQLVNGNQNWTTSIQGVTRDYVTATNWKVESGRGFSAEDDTTATMVCILGQTVEHQLFSDTENPVGATILVKGQPMAVIGIFEAKGQSTYGQDQDDIVMVPFTTAERKILGVAAPSQVADTLSATYPPAPNPFGLTPRITGYVNQIYVQAVSADRVQAAIQQVTATLVRRHHIRAGDPDDFSVRNLSQIADTAESSSKIMALLLAIVASISLVVGGIGIMNILLVSVTERTREIGLRMAIGARRLHVLLQFLVEAIVLSITGGLAGIITGIVASKLISVVGNWPTMISSPAIVGGFVFSALVGVFFGFYPARKAANLDPIEALRYE